MTSSQDQRARTQQVRARAADYLGISSSSPELAVWFEPASGQFSSGDAHIVEWLEGPAQGAHRWIAPGAFLPGTWTEPWDDKSIAVHFD